MIKMTYKSDNKITVTQFEYKEIQHLRDLWSRGLMTWGQIFIPLILTVLIVAISQLPNFKEQNWGTQYLFLVWMILTIFIIYWRGVVHHIDKTIVWFYPRMLELEKETGMHLHSLYFFHNINKDAKKILAKKVNKEFKELNDMDYAEFRDTVISQGKNPQQLLLEIWKTPTTKFHKSVTRRGHGIQELILILIDISFLIYFLIGSILSWW